MTSPDIYRLVDSYAAWDEQGALPVEGGHLAQARVWTRWVKIINVERARIEEERQKKGKKRDD